ncbi:Cro/CI family transcriptional regulator [Acinetobacter baumannii]|uniref:Cro/CI family transcriptional regulator n=1 Tax=Acinetobacter baumannii TaxID=470 RepID=UPI00208EE20E|nr:Cro/CI family transcriptional regulator [Acinetobacter baumannii]
MNMEHRLVSKYQEVVSHFGSQSSTARALGVSQPSVFSWVKGLTEMSEKVAIRTQKVTDGKFKAADLCPSLRELEEIDLSKN